MGSDLDLPSRIYDYINAGAIIINLLISILYTSEEVRDKFGSLFVLIEGVTVAFRMVRIVRSFRLFRINAYRRSGIFIYEAAFAGCK